MFHFARQTLALTRVPRLDPERVAALQLRRLRSLVRTAIDRAPYLREKYRGIDPDRVTLADLPPTNKGELMAHFDGTITDPAIRRADLERFLDDPGNEGRRFLGRFIASHTSGSQGQPMLMVQQPRHLELLFGLQMTRGYAGKVGLFEAITRPVHRKRLAVIHLDRDFFPTASTFEHMPTAPRWYLNVLRLPQTATDLPARLEAFRPHALTAYASVLEMLALEAQAGRLRLPDLTQITSNSERLTDRARARIEAAFGQPVLDNYATGECPFLANGCPAGPGSHVNADWASLEVVDEQYRPVPDGTPGAKVLITNLVNTLQPLIRYEIGDVVTMATEPCGCGSRLPRVASIQGRAADAFWIRDGGMYRRVLGLIFTHSFEFLRDVREWQAVQVERNRVHVRLEMLPGQTLDLERARRILDRQLEQYGDLGVLDIALEPVARLENDARTGKFRRMISLVGAPADLDAPTGSGVGLDAHEPSGGLTTFPTGMDVMPNDAA